MVELASDFLDRNTPVFRDDVCFFISQSGDNNTQCPGCYTLPQQDDRDHETGFKEKLDLHCLHLGETNLHFSSKIGF